MRLMTAILSFYLMLLTVLPCCAFDNCPEDREQSETACQTNTHQGGDKDGCGSCSPFFNCHHCAGFNFSAKTVAFQTQTIETPPAKPVAAEDNFHLSSYQGTIWQPPRA
jgi:hypothetical protein